MMHRTRHRVLPALLAAGLLLVPLTACSAVSGADTSMSAGVAPATQTSADEMHAIDGTSESAPRAEKSIIHTGDLRLSVDDPKTSADAVAETARSFGGSVESMSVWGSGEGTTAAITVRIPADELEAAFEALSELGTVESENRSAVDVTTEHVDLQARVAALETSVERLQNLMADASTTSDLLEAESMLSQRQQELDGLRAQLQALEGQVAESTITVSLTSPSVLPGGGPANFWEGLLAGLSALGTAGAGALVVLGLLLPWLVVAGIIALAVVLIVRGARRRRRAARTAATHAPQAPTAPQAPPAQQAPIVSQPAPTQTPGSDQPATGSSSDA